MKLVVLAKAHQVLQQTGLLDLRPAVADLHAAPVGLARDRAVAFEQVAGQHLAHRLLAKSGAQQLGGRRVAAAFHIESVQIQAVEFLHRFAVEHVRQQQLHANL